MTRRLQHTVIGRKVMALKDGATLAAHCYRKENANAPDRLSEGN